MRETGRLLAIMARLRAPDGCPWDREQTPSSLRTYVLEEAFEVADAIDGGDWDELRDELGDLLLQVVFLAQVADEGGHFAFEDVARAIADKLERRHPHVFGEDKAENAEQVWQRWDAVKRAEKQGRDDRSRLSGLPRHLPSLVKAHRLAEKAARAGFDWPGAPEVLDKVDEELAELRAELQDGDVVSREEELGDLLFTIASLARHLAVDPEAALAHANRKFVRRFQEVERRADAGERSLEEHDAEELEELWREAKDAVDR